MKKKGRIPTLVQNPSTAKAQAIRSAQFDDRSEWRLAHREASRSLLGFPHEGKRMLEWDRKPACANNLVAIGIGEKRVNGRFAGEPAVVFFVKRKRATRYLSRAEHLPKTIDGYATDVISMGLPRFASGQAIQASSEIYVDSDRTGTLGAFLENENGRRYAITNGHVTGPDRGETVYASGKALGVVEDVYIPEPGVWNEVDLATIAVNSDVQIDPSLPNVGVIAGPGSPEGTCRICGSISKGTGELFTTRTIVPIQGTNYGVQNIHVYRPSEDFPFAVEGDSGSIIVEENTQSAVGMLFAVQGQFGLAIPIDEIMSKLPGMHFL